MSYWTETATLCLLDDFQRKAGTKETGIVKGVRSREILYIIGGESKLAILGSRIEAPPKAIDKNHHIL